MTSIRSVSGRQRGTVASTLLHAAVVVCLFGGLRWGPRVAPYKLPGTVTGVQTLTYFSSGHQQPHSAEVPVIDAQRKPPQTVAPDALEPAGPADAQTVKADAGPGDAVKSGRGEGNIDIALQTFFPYPRPDLSSLKRGTGGDVILNAVIDEHGRIASLTLVKGLGDPIDQTVMATVQLWSYTPATKDGVPVASEQELHFHYERG